MKDRISLMDNKIMGIELLIRRKKERTSGITAEGTKNNVKPPKKDRIFLMDRKSVFVHQGDSILFLLVSRGSMKHTEVIPRKFSNFAGLFLIYTKSVSVLRKIRSFFDGLTWQYEFCGHVSYYG